MKKKQEQINEFGGGFAAGAKDLATRIGKGAITGLGKNADGSANWLGQYTGKMQGSLDVQKTVGELKAQYNRALGTLPAGQQQASIENLIEFLGNLNNGQEYAADVQAAWKSIAQQSGQNPQQQPPPVNGTQGTGTGTPPQAQTPTPTATPQAPVDPATQAKIDADKAAFGGMANRSEKQGAGTPAPSGAGQKSGSSQNNRDYENQTMGQIGKAARQQQPDTKQVIQLTKELIAHAKDNGGGEKNRTKIWLKKMQNDPAIQNNQKLAGFFRSMKLESITRAFNLAMYLVENEVSTKRALYEAVTSFIMNEDTLLNRQQLDQLLNVVAGKMVRNGDSTTQQNGGGNEGNPNQGRAANQTNQNGQNQQPASQTTPQTRQSNAAMQTVLRGKVDVNALITALQTARIDPSLMQAIINAANTDPTRQKILNGIHVNLPPAAYLAIMSS